MRKSRDSTSRDIRFQKRLAILLLVIGVLAMGVGGNVFAQTRRFCRSASRAPGRIVEVEQRRDGKEITLFPVFSFVDRAGVSHVIHAKFGQIRSRWTFARSYTPGDSVEVLYSPDDPERARLNDFLSVWGWTLLLGGGGLLFAIAGMVLWHGAVTWPRGPAGASRDRE